MAKCDEGYLCQICGEEVKGLLQSDLYLRYVIGWVDPETLHLQAERHIRCNPSLAQFIEDDAFDAVLAEGDGNKNNLDQEFVNKRTELVSRGYRRLKELAKSGLPITQYPLPEFQQRYTQD